jgi:L-erythro-3,5-diaminohexanoate dehydrogenase
MTWSASETRQRLGVDRVLEPTNALPQGADRLEASGPVRPYEIEVSVERLGIDSTSYRNLSSSAGDDTDAIRTRVQEIVEERGKMHNPDTDSGGILLGTVTAVGECVPGPPTLGTRVVPMASLTAIPLSLEAVTAVDPKSPQIGVQGTAYFREPWATLPDDLPEERALELLDVCPAASQTKPLVPHNGTVCVLGVGNAGKLALATARKEMQEGQVVAIDIDAAAVERVLELGLCDVGVSADLRDPLSTLEAVRSAGVRPADLTIVVVNATRCESTAILLTAEGGTALFLSMATSFGAAALNEGFGLDLRLLIGRAHADDRGAYALDLYRGTAALRDAFEAPS